MPDVIIISTGYEFIYGTTINTNCSFISNLFWGSNFKVLKHITIGDEIESIVSVLNQSINEADMVITTGGLGPADNNNTVDAVCSVLNIHPVLDEESNNKFIDYYRSMNCSINNNDHKISTVPENSLVIQNIYGPAPGFIVRHMNKIIISLPGIPSQAEKMMINDILPYLKKFSEFYNKFNLNYKISDIKESDINRLINELSLPDSVKTCIIYRSGVYDVLITGFTEYSADKERIDICVRNKFYQYLVEYNTAFPEEELISLLIAKKLTISTAESCTGGLIAKKITDISGASEVYKGSVIAYSNDIKKYFLDVPVEILNSFGAVSEVTAAKMAISIKNKFNTDISVSTTGIAGPGGGNETKPVGMICFGFKIKEYLFTTTKFFKGERDTIRNLSSLYSINYLINYIKNTY